MPVLPIRRHDVHGGHVVEREPEAACEPPEAAAEREATDARVRDRPGGSHEPTCHRLVIEVAEQALRAAGSIRTPRIRERSRCIPPSQVDCRPWPPHFTANNSECSRANVTAVRTSAAPLACTTSAG